MTAENRSRRPRMRSCLLYPSDAADEPPPLSFACSPCIMNKHRLLSYNYICFFCYEGVDYGGRDAYGLRRGQSGIRVRPGQVLSSLNAVCFPREQMSTFVSEDLLAW